MTDALTSIFNLLDLRSARCTRLEAAGEWSLRFPEKLALKFVAVIHGECWILHPDLAPVQMAKGDVFLLSQTPAYVLASDPQLPPEDGAKVIDWEGSDVGRYDGEDTVLLGESFQVNPLHERLLTEALPHLMLLPGDASAASTLSRTLETPVPALGLDANIVAHFARRVHPLACRIVKLTHLGIGVGEDNPAASRATPSIALLPVPA